MQLWNHKNHFKLKMRVNVICNLDQPQRIPDPSSNILCSIRYIYKYLLSYIVFTIYYLISHEYSAKSVYAYATADVYSNFDDPRCSVVSCRQSARHSRGQRQ